jgi:putative hydroxymethylpyrimidine transport system ATP-binding protein
LNAPGIEIKGATLLYENHLLFQDLNLKLLASKWTCLLGPSGVGKTSLLRLIAGLASDVSLKMMRASDNLPLANRIAYMAQQESLLPWLTIVENVVIGLKLRGIKVTTQDYDRAKQLLEQVGLEKYVAVKPPVLSGGMRQRAILARTVFEDKPVVLMDEPFAALDVITRAYIQELAAELFAGRTVLLVTHDPLEALRLGHHVYIMSGSPARITSEIELPNQPPRPLTDKVLLETHGQILEQLSHATKAQSN